MITQTCIVSGKIFTITDKDQAFYKKIGVPLPKLCPTERQKRRLVWRNERNLYKRKCDATGKNIVSIYHPDQPFPVYEQSHWWSDDWDGTDYGQEYDFSRPFFEQYQELVQKVPRLSIINSNSQNSAYTNFSSGNKNCYYTFGMFFDEEVHYCHYGSHCRSSLDCLRISHCELCYECVDCDHCYELFFSQNSQNCNTSWFLKNCIGCNNCFGCINLRNKQYYFLNQKCTPEEYAQKIAQVDLQTFEGLQKMRIDFQKFCEQFPHRYMVGTQNENVTGDYLYNCKNCTDCFDSADVEDCRYGYQIDAVKSSYDLNCMGYDMSELCYENTGGTGSFECLFCECVWMVSNLTYCGQCFNSQDLFGCIGLNQKKYCILGSVNKLNSVEYVV